MDKCSICDRDLQPGFQFCHFCGTPVQGVLAEQQRKELVEWIDEAKKTTSTLRNSTSSLLRSIDNLMGNKVSIRRQILYALLAGVVASLLELQAPGITLMNWFETWLILSVIFWPFIRFWMTGRIPGRGVINSILGPELSLQRRIVLSCVLSAVPAMLVFMGSIASLQFAISSGQPIGILLPVISALFALSIFLLAFYFMGFTVSWRKIDGREFSLLRDQLATKADDVAGMFRDRMKERKISNLELTEIELSTLHQYTAEYSAGIQGHQLNLICGKVRIVVFAQTFGDSLLIRWLGYFNVSGRRLWLLIGLAYLIIEGVFLKWTGSSPVEFFKAYIRILTPVSRSRVFLEMAQGNTLSRMFGLVGGFSEYTWNEFYALEGAVTTTLIDAVVTAHGSHFEEQAIRAQIVHHNQLESRAMMRGVGVGSSR